MSHSNQDDPVIRLEPANGIAFIPKPTALTRLHYFDGKFLRADDLRAEQNYTRALVHRSNQAGGWGVVHGFHTQLGAGASLVLHPGLAIDPKGKVLALPGPQTVSVEIDALVAASRPEAAASPAGPSGGPAGFGGCAIPPADGYVDPIAPSDLYLIVICHIEAACGIDEQFGTLCVDACATETDYRYLVEGIEVRALPLSALTIPDPTGWPVANGNLRSRVASAFFAEEPEQISLISGDGLRDPAWCFGAEPGAQTCVPLGLLAYTGDTVRFFDPWIARRERMEGPPRRYWGWRMRMRPWSVFLAHVLQFQCHLVEATGLAPLNPGSDPCAEDHALLDEATAALDALRRQYQDLLARMGDGAANAGLLESLEALMARLQTAQAARGDAPDDHVLLKRGILELPSAGYLPVDAQRRDSVNAQVRALLGDGVNLRFCVVRPDYVAHALEEAQHLDRISLTEGLADPERMPAVDILVPDGIILETAASVGSAWRARGTYRESLAPEAPYNRGGGNAMDAWAHGMVVNPGKRPPVELAGMGRSVITRDGAARATFAGGGSYRETIVDRDPETGEKLGERAIEVEVATFLGMQLDQSPFDLAIGQSTSARLRGIAAVRGDEGTGVQIALQGGLTITARESAEHVTGRLSVQGGRNELRRGGEALFARFEVILRFRLLGDGGSFTMEAQSDEAGQIFSTARWSGTPRVMRVLFAWLHADFERPGVEQPRVEQPAEAVDIRHHDQPAMREHAAAERARDDRGQEPFVVELDLTRDGLVERADDVDRQRAERGIEVIAQELRDPSFQTEAQALLFPPVANEGSLIVQATRDWVLFHRRRERTCAVPPPPPPTPPVTPVRYEVLVVADTDSGAGFEKAVLEALAGRPSEDDLLDGVRRVGAVEFMPGRSALWSDADALRARWSDVDPGLEASLAVIGGADVLPAVGRGRLDQVIGALSTVSDELPQPTDFSEAIITVLEGSTARYPTVGHDGFILFVVAALADVVTECHEVWLVENAKASAHMLSDLSVFDLQDQYGARPLGELDFRPGDAAPLEDPARLPDAPAHISEVGVVYRGPGPADAAEVEGIARSRAGRVALGIDPLFDGGPGLENIVYRGEEPAPDGCQGQTVLFVRPRIYSVAVHFINAPSPERARVLLEDNPNGDPDTMHTPEEGVPLVFEEFELVNGDPALLQDFIDSITQSELLWSTLTPTSGRASRERERMADVVEAIFNEVGIALPRPDEEIPLPAESDLWGINGSFVLIVGIESL